MRGRRYEALSWNEGDDEFEEKLSAISRTLSAGRERSIMDNSAPNGEDQESLYDDFTLETDGTLLQDKADEFDENDTRTYNDEQTSNIREISRK